MAQSTRWYGDCGGTSPLFFYYEERPNQPEHTDYMRSQFRAVRGLLQELTRERDGNGDPVVKLVAEPSGPVRKPYVAYRWTSDWARRTYDRELVRIGGSLGRGVWQPFGAGKCGEDLMLQPLEQPELVTVVLR